MNKIECKVCCFYYSDEDDDRPYCHFVSGWSGDKAPCDQDYIPEYDPSDDI